MMTRVPVLAWGLLFLTTSFVRAAVTITAASGGTAISADTAASGGTGAWTTLGTITITESAKGDINAGSGLTLVIKTPAGFEFNTSSIPSVSFTAGLDIQSASVAFNNASSMVVTFTVSASNVKDTLRIGATGLRVRPTAGAPLATGMHLYRPSTGGGTAVINGISTSSNGSSGSNFGNLTEVGGAAVKLGILLPGQTAAPGTATGKTGTPSPQTNGQPFNVQVRAADAFWNLANTNHQVRLSSSDAQASLPPAGPLSSGSITFPVTLKTDGSQTLTAADLTNPGILPATSSPVMVYPNLALKGGPVVAIHDSELTRALALTNAAATTPTGAGTTGKEWWPTNWNYHVLPESLKEA